MKYGNRTAKTQVAPAAPSKSYRRRQRLVMRVSDKILKLVDMQIAAIERKLAPPPAPAPGDPFALSARRWAADLMGLWKLCDQARCRRARCCHGTRRDCLPHYMREVPHDVRVAARDAMQKEIETMRRFLAAERG